MDTKKKQSYNLYKTNANENSTKLLFKNDKLSFNSTPRYKTSYSNSKANSKIMDKKYINKRDEILKKSKTTQYANNTRKINYNEKPKESTAQNLFNFTYPYMNKKDKEGLIVDLYHVSNEMDEQNNKLEELQQEYNNLISNSLAFKIIIEKILGVDENGNAINKNDNNEQKGNVNNNVNNNNINNNENNNNKIKENSKSENNLKLSNNPINQNNNNENLPQVNNNNENNINNNNINIIAQKKCFR